MSLSQPSTSVVRWHRVDDAAAMREAVCIRILGAADRAIEQRGQFLIVLAGGSSPRGIYDSLRLADTDWSRWQVYFGDERCLPVDDPRRNSRMAAEAWLDHVAVPARQVHTIPAELGANAAALAYADTLRAVGDFDLVLLGLGEDGHTASLFPGREWGIAPGAPDALAVLDAPKPPTQRVSLSAARLGRTRELLFLVAGAAKRDALARWRGGESLPAAAIQPVGGVDAWVEAVVLDAQVAQSC